MFVPPTGRSGREERLSLSRAATARRVVVVGAGAAGLEAARIAALRGHHVTLLERHARLGGSLFFAATVHEENEPLLDFLLNEVERLPIDVQGGTAASAAAIASLEPDVAIIAGGEVSALPAANKNIAVGNPNWSRGQASIPAARCQSVAPDETSSARAPEGIAAP